MVMIKEVLNINQRSLIRRNQPITSVVMVREILTAGDRGLGIKEFNSRHFKGKVRKSQHNMFRVQMVRIKKNLKPGWSIETKNRNGDTFYMLKRKPGVGTVLDSPEFVSAVEGLLDD